MLALLDGLAVQRSHDAGVSVGGAMGQQLALDAAERLLSLTVCASAARFADPPSWTARAATRIPLGRFGVVLQAAHLVNAERPAEVDQALVEHLRRVP